MPYELWALSSGNAITETDDAAEMRRLIRELIAIGWSADDLSLDTGEGVLDGEELLAWLD